VTVDLSVPQRQPALAILFLGLRTVRSLGITQLIILVLFVFRGPFGGAPIILLFGGFSALAWWRYTFQLVDGELIVVKGVFRMNRLTVPIERIQSIAIDQPLFHRLIGLVKVTIDTAGSAATELTIDAIDRPVAEALQAAAVTSLAVAAPSEMTPGTDDAGWAPPATAPALAPPVAQDRAVFTHDARRLLITAITMWPLAGLVVIGSLVTLGGNVIEQVLDRIPMVDDFKLDPDAFRWSFVPVGVTVFVLLSVVLNIVRVFLQDWQLTLRVTPTSLRRTSGLLSRTSTASSVARVQVISSGQNPLQQRVGLRNVDLANVGEGDLSLPGCDHGQFEAVTVLAASTPIEQLDLVRRVHPAQIWLGVRTAVLQASLVAGAGFFVIGWWSAFAFALVPIRWLMQRRHVRNFRWALGTELATFSRVVDTTTQQALLRKANSVRVSQTLFERRRGLGRVHLTTAAGVVSVGMLPIIEACAVRDIVLHAAETDRRPWM
jgi:putative membrane protein